MNNSIDLLDLLSNNESLSSRIEKICPSCGETKILSEFRTSVNPEPNEPLSRTCYDCLCNARYKADNKRGHTLERQTQLKNHRYTTLEVGSKLRPDNEHWARKACSGAKSRAIKEGLPFSITYKDIMDIMPKDSRFPILGLELIPSKDKSQDNSPSLDKVIPNLGYIVGNIRVLCERANRAKNNLTVNEIKRIWIDCEEHITGKKLEVYVSYK